MKKFLSSLKKPQKNLKNAKTKTTEQVSPTNSQEFINFVQLNNQFAAEMTKILRESTAINSIYSPFFIRNLIAMMRIGAADLAALELERGLKMYSETIPSNFIGFAASLTKMIGFINEMNQLSKQPPPPPKPTSRFPAKKVNPFAAASAAKKGKLAAAEPPSSAQVPEGITLTYADRIYIAKGFEICESFAKSLKELFQTTIELLDFQDSIKAAEVINSWFQSKTEGKIESIIQPISLNGVHTRMVLLSGVHFQGELITKFNRKSTKKGSFQVNPKKQVDCQMMGRKGPTFYTDLSTINCQAIALPYVGEKLVMLIICNKKPKPPPPPPLESSPVVDPTAAPAVAVEKSKTGFELLAEKAKIVGSSSKNKFAKPAKVTKPVEKIPVPVEVPLPPPPPSSTATKNTFIENRYTKETEISIDEIINSMAESEMEVKLPKFKMEYSTHFIQPLKQLGMRTIFDPISANFSGIPGYDMDGLFISEIIQKVVFEVNDKDEPPEPKGKRGRFGRRPMATASFRPFGRAGRKDGKKKKAPKSITIDRPFVFYLIDKSNHNLVLLSGYCSNPNVTVETFKHSQRNFKMGQKSLKHKAGIC